MRKLILTIVFCALASTVWADHWVYVRLEDRVGPTADDTAGRSKYGDIVAILPVDDQHVPSEREKAEYLIVRVRGLDDAIIQELRGAWEEIVGTDEQGLPITRPKAYRKNLFDVRSAFIENLTPGLWPDTINYNTIKNRIRIKTDTDLAKYEAKTRLYAMYRPFKIAYYWYANRMIFAYAETISTVNKTGEDYNTLTLWEDAKDGDLVTETRQETAHLYDDDGELNDTVSIDGSTTDATYFMKVTAPSGERHNGISGGFTINPSTAGHVISIDDQYTVIEYIHIRDFGGSGFNSRALNFSADSDNSRFSHNLIHDEVSGNNGAGIYANTGNSAGKLIYNNVVYNTGAWGIKGDSGFGGVSNAYNNTVYGCTNGMSGRFGEMIMKNNISYNNTTDFAFTTASDDYNFSKDDSAAGANSIHGDTDGKTPDFVSTTGGSEDFHLQSTSDAIDVGTDLSGTFTDDIDGTTRSGTWDIGADEFVAAGGSTFKSRVIIY